MNKIFRASATLSDFLPDFVTYMEEGAFGPTAPRIRRRRPVNPVARIGTAPGPGGRILFTLVFHLPLTLAPVLAALLIILANDTGTSEDELVGWKTFEEVLSEIRSLTGKKSFSAKALKQAIYRLREALEAGDLPRGLLQTNTVKKSYRFAIKHKKPDVIGGDRM